MKTNILSLFLILFISHTAFSSEKLAFISAAEANNLEKAKALIQPDFVNVESSKEKDTLLNFTIKHSFNEVSKLLIENGADLKITNDKGETPLHAAAQSPQGGAKLIPLLIEKGASVTAVDKEGNTPLHFAIDNNLRHFIEPLIEKGADKNAMNEKGETPLHIAVENKNYKAAIALIEKGADVNIKNKEENTILHQLTKEASKPAKDDSSLKAKEFILSFLNSTGVELNLNITNKEGLTPLMLAVQNHLTDVAIALIEKGADVKVKDAQNNSIAHIIALKTLPLEDLSKIIQSLQEKRFSFNDKNNQGETPLSIAVQFQTTEVLEMFIKAGAGVNQRFSDGNTFLHVFAEKGQFELLKFFVDQGAEVEVRNNNGDSPTELAVKRKHYDVARFLIDKGARTDKIDLKEVYPFYTTQKHLQKAKGAAVELFKSFGNKAKGGR